MGSRRTSLLLAVALLFAWQAPAQEAERAEQAEPATDELFFETVQVHLVNVDVYVTDKKGNPIAGLTRDDFEILEDGRPQTVTNFFAFEERRPVSSKPGGGGAGVPRGPEEPGGLAAEQPAAPGARPLSLVVYIDNFNIRPFNRNRVFRRLREFLHDRLAPEDRVMLVSYDRSLHIRQPFTGEPALVSSALFDMEKLTGFALSNDSERRDLIEEIDRAEDQQDVEWRVRQYAEAMFNDLRFSLGALREIVDSLAGLPGRKALLYVSDGIPMIPGEDLFYGLQQKFLSSSVLSRLQDYDASRRIQALASQAAANGVTFYTIDAAGLRPPTSVSVGRASSTAPGIDTFIDSVYISNLQSPLRLMAEETGGRAILNTNDVGPGLDEMARDFGTYYSLGFTPAHFGDGRYHKIEVKVLQKGLEVRHRQGYRDKSPTTRMTDGVLSTLKYGVEANPLSISVSFGEGQAQERADRYVVPVWVDIPLQEVALVPRSQQYQGRVKLYFAAMDEEGGMADVQEVPLAIEIPREEIEQARSSVYRYELNLLMRTGGHRLAVGVWDELGGESSFVRRGVLVGQG